MATVLVVEADKLIADDVRSALGELGYEVLGEAATYGQASERAAQLRPALVVVDLRRPAGSASGATAAAIEVGRGLALPTVYATSASETRTVPPARSVAAALDPLPGCAFDPADSQTFRRAIEAAGKWAGARQSPREASQVWPPDRARSSKEGPAASMGKLAQQGDGRRAKVLVVDDEPAVANSIARMLRVHHEATVESDPRRALARLLARESYDVILCDLMMAPLSGIDLHASLAASAPEQAQRIVFMTGGAFSARSLAFLDRVGNRSVAKPFGIDVLRAIVSEYLK